MQTHALLRIDSADAVCGETAAPLWVGERLARAPWVVVRRTRGRDGLVPVGVRGGTRAERFAGWVCPGKVLEYLTPQQLAARRGWRGHPRRVQIAALAVLDEVESIMARARLGSHWGPAGSVAFELASGCATASCASDADLVLLPGEPLPVASAGALLAQLVPLPARVDVLLETPAGGVALAEYAHGRAPFLVRTPDGPRLLVDPWAGTAAAA